MPLISYNNCNAQYALKSLMIQGLSHDAKIIFARIALLELLMRTKINVHYASISF